MSKLIFTERPEVELERIVADSAPGRLLVVTDTNTSAIYHRLFPNHSPRWPEVTIAAGEAHKTIGSLEKVWSVMAGAGLNRRDMIVNVGGGTVTDLGGFAAATYMRGIRYVNIPTTLLACVDASTGGKTAIDFRGVKNLIGAFHAPVATIVSQKPLVSLPREELLSGWAEMIKHGLLDCDEHLNHLLDNDIPQVDSCEMLDIIRCSVGVKRRVVEQDPAEKGLRRCLNLGHTAGHALESLCLQRGTPISHGHAVALGILAELRLSGGFPQEKYTRLREYILARYPLPTLGETDVPRLAEFMLSDKKNLTHDDGEVAYIALRDTGTPDIYATAPASELARSLVCLGAKN